MNKCELKANMGLVVRGDFEGLNDFAKNIENLIAKNPSVQLVYKHVSASKLWIKEGDAMNDGNKS